jgi:hypothetical protein
MSRKAKASEAKKKFEATYRRHIRKIESQSLGLHKVQPANHERDTTVLSTWRQCIFGSY